MLLEEQKKLKSPRKNSEIRPQLHRWSSFNKNEESIPVIYTIIYNSNLTVKCTCFQNVLQPAVL